MVVQYQRIARGRKREKNEIDGSKVHNGGEKDVVQVTACSRRTRAAQRMKRTRKMKRLRLGMGMGMGMGKEMVTHGFGK